MEPLEIPQAIQSLSKILEEKQVPSQMIQGILPFYEKVLEENRVQNLTRLLDPLDFYQGHVVDVLELLGTGCVDYPALDLGSGVGVPGLLAAILQEGSQWILAESELRKAEYLNRVVRTLEKQSQVQVFHRRGEEVLQSLSVGSVVVRAVGKVEKIYSWIRKCSTWNNLILLKGPKWEEEWEEFSRSRFKGELETLFEYPYGVENGLKTRRIIKLIRKKKV